MEKQKQIDWLNEVSKKAEMSVIRVAAEYGYFLRRGYSDEVARVKAANKLINKASEC